MNHIDKPSVYRGNERSVNNWEVIGSQAPVAEPIEETTSTDTSESVEETEQSITTEPESVETPRIESSEEPQTTDDTESTEDNVETDSQTEETPYWESDALPESLTKIAGLPLLRQPHVLGSSI